MSNSRLSCWNGTLLIDDTDEYLNQGIYGFKVRAGGAVIATAETSASPGFDLLAELNLTGKSLAEGEEYFFPLDKNADVFQLVSGEVIAYRE